jgi:hypothetical protein
MTNEKKIEDLFMANYLITSVEKDDWALKYELRQAHDAIYKAIRRLIKESKSEET